MQIKIAWLRSIHSGAALAREPHCGSLPNAGRNIYFNGLGFQHLARAAAGLASLVLHETGAVTSRTDFSHLHLQRASSTPMCLFKREFQLGFDVFTAFASPGAAPARTTEHFLEDVEASRTSAAEIKAAEIETTALWSTCSTSPLPAWRRCAPSLLHGAPILTIFIKQLPIFLIRERIVGFLQLFEPLFRSLVTRIQVRMILAREFAVCRLDFIGRGTATDAEHLVIVFGLYCHLFSKRVEQGKRGKRERGEQGKREKRNLHHYLLLPFSPPFPF